MARTGRLSGPVAAGRSRHRGDLRREDGQDALHEQLGGFLDPVDEEQLKAAMPAAAVDGAVVRIGELAKRLERKTDAIRNWIELGIIPPAPVRLAGNVRAWPAAEANAIITAARRERIPSKPRRPISETNFSLRAWEARTAQQMRGDREAEAK
jgi:hypothetical protein